MNHVNADDEEIENDKNDFIWMRPNYENVDAEIARLCSKRSEFNPSVGKSQNLEDYSHHSKQLGIGKFSRKWISKEKEDTFIEKVKTSNSYWFWLP